MNQQAQQAATSAKTAQTNAESAAAVAAEAAEKAETVIADISAAKEAAAAAEESAQLAADSEDAAEASASSALQSQTLAQGYSNAAGKSATSAGQSAENAASSENAAKTAETNSAASAGEAAESARLAAQSESNAAKSASAAGSSAAQAKSYRDAAVQSASQAEGSASAAAESEGNAADKATQAGQFASDALFSSESAETSKIAAAESANTATQKSTEATASAGQAASSAEAAKSWAVGGTGTRENEDSDNAKYYAQLAQTVAQGAQGYFVTAAALKAAHPSGQDGWWAIVGETDTIWIWDSDTGEWVDSSTAIDMSNYYTKQESDERYATAAQGAKADSAVQSVNGVEPDASGNVQVSAGEGAVKSVNGKDPDGDGNVQLTAADVGAATAAQGGKADTAVQPADLEDYAKTGDIPSALPNPNSLLLKIGTGSSYYNGQNPVTATITPDTVGAAEASHSHSASDISSGTLPVSRGGTGASTATAARSQLGASPINHASSGTSYGKGTASMYGHVKLSDTASTSNGVSSGVAATPKCVADAVAGVQIGYDLYTGVIDDLYTGISGNSYSDRYEVPLSRDATGNLTDYSVILTVEGQSTYDAMGVTACVVTKSETGFYVVLYNNTDNRTTVKAIHWLVLIPQRT